MQSTLSPHVVAEHRDIIRSWVELMRNRDKRFNGVQHDAMASVWARHRTTTLASQPKKLPVLNVGDYIGGQGDSKPVYQILGHIAAGGAGRVYRAKLCATNEVVVIKQPREWRAVFDLMQESRYMAREVHPHVARLRDVDTAVLPDLALEFPFLVMDSYAKSLLTYMGQVRINPVWALRTIANCARGLHACQLIHRDLKPENILLDEKNQSYICDFGLAIPAGPMVRKRLGMVISGISGTYIYMSPEQVFEEPSIDVRSDIFALGLILYELLTGRSARPSQKDYPGSEEEFLSMIADHEVSWRDVKLDVIAEIVRLCTSLTRRDRYPDYWALLDAIDDAVRTLEG